MIDRRFLDVSLVVQGVANEPEANPTTGTQYIVDEMPTGDFENAEPSQIARYDGEKWNFITPKEAGLEVINVETGELLRFDGVLWEPITTLGGGNSSENSSSSVLVVDDLALVVSSNEELPNDYIFNICIVDNGLNTPVLNYYSVNSKKYRGPFFFDDDKYYDVPTKVILAGTNGKYYTLNAIFDYVSSIEVSEMAVGSLILNKTYNFLYQWNGTSLELVGGNFIRVDYAGVSDTESEWSDTDYFKYIGEVGLRFQVRSTSFLSPDIDYRMWIPSRLATPKAGDLFASTNHCMLYIYDKNLIREWTPVAFLKKGTVIYSDFDKATYESNGTTLEKIKKDEFIIVKDVCKFCTVGFSFSKREANEGDKCLNYDDVKKYFGNEVWSKYSDLAYGNRYLVLSEDNFDSNEPCIYEYVESGQGNMSEYAQFNRYNLSKGATIFNEDDGKLYVYNGTNIEVLESEYEQDKEVILPIFPMCYVFDNLYEDASAVKEGDKFFDKSNFILSTVIKSGERRWENFDDGVELKDGERFISLTDFKIYTIKEDYDNEKKLIISDIPKGYMFLNETDGNMYFFNGTTIIMLKSGKDSFEGLDLGEITG